MKYMQMPFAERNIDQQHVHLEQSSGYKKKWEGAQTMFYVESLHWHAV